MPLLIFLSLCLSLCGLFRGKEAAERKRGRISERERGKERKRGQRQRKRGAEVKAKREQSQGVGKVKLKIVGHVLRTFRPLSNIKLVSLETICLAHFFDSALLPFPFSLLLDTLFAFFYPSFPRTRRSFRLCPIFASPSKEGAAAKSERERQKGHSVRRKGRE